MSATQRVPMGAAILAAALAVTGPAAGQNLAARVAAAPDGLVRFSFSARAGVVGDGRGGITWPCADESCGRRREAGRVAAACDSGPVRVTLTKRGDAVLDASIRVSAVSPPEAGATDLGPVSTRAASAYLTALARTAPERVGRETVFAATLADSVTVWPDLLALARDETVLPGTRTAAVFWVGQTAGVAVTRGLTELVGRSDAEREIQEAAVFALSQRPADEGVPALIGVARDHRDPRIRRQAMFWLGQTQDPRALAFFEEILTGS